MSASRARSSERATLPSDSMRKGGPRVVSLRRRFAGSILEFLQL